MEFTLKEAEWLVDHLKDVWNDINQDMYVDDQGRYDESIVLPKSEVVMVCTDRMEISGASIFQRLVIAKFWQCPNDHPGKKAIIDKAFPYEAYGC